MSIFFFFNDTATTEIYTLSLHDALPISARLQLYLSKQRRPYVAVRRPKSESCELRRFLPLPSNSGRKVILDRSEEHTSELQSRLHLVCRLLLEKKKLTNTQTSTG